MGAIASQITTLTIVFSTVYLDIDQRKHQSSASLAFARGIHRIPVISPHKWPVRRKMFPFDDVIMTTWYNGCSHNGNKFSRCFSNSNLCIGEWLLTAEKILDGCKKKRTSSILQSTFSHFTHPLGTAAVDSSKVDTAIAAELLSSWQIILCSVPSVSTQFACIVHVGQHGLHWLQGVQMESARWPLLLRHYGIELNINISKPRQMAATLQIAFSNSFLMGITVSYSICPQWAKYTIMIQHWFR